MLLKDFLKEGTARLESLYPAAEAKNLMLMLCEERIATRSYTHVIEPGYSIEDKALGVLTADLEKLSAGEPVQYVLGYAEFCGLRFKVGPDVLIPRPETELMCLEAIKAGSGMKPPVRVLDLCTGSGCIAWTLALNIPGSVVTGVDISKEALETAKGQDFGRTLRDTGASAPIFMQADVLGEDSVLGARSFDIIVSNPPYIMEKEKPSMRPNVLEHEPPLALFVPDDDPLLFYRAIARWSADLLSPDGVGMTEINELLGPETADVFLKAGFANVRVVKDFSGKNRFVHYRK